MPPRPLRYLIALLALLASGIGGCSVATSSGDTAANGRTTAPTVREQMRDGSPERPLRMLAMGSDARSMDQVRKYLQPVLDVITRETGLHFELRFGDSYAASLEALEGRHADFAQLSSPWIYLKARERGVAELLAMQTRDGDHTYYGGIFATRASGIKTLKDLKGRSCAFGDINSMSSFNYPSAMLLHAGVDPSRDLSVVYLTGSHDAVLAAMAAGKVDAGCCAIGTFENAVREGRIDPEKIILVAKSDAIPGSPLAMYPKLPEETRKKLRQGFEYLDKHPEALANIRTDSGRKMDRFDTSISDADFDKVTKFLRPVTEEYRTRMMAKAGKKP
ncbi:MAG: phosphate/phosphite/phosphonate ABC transporter substrate-binding protein [Capsulimonadales bacterium]|nr:phosphate/phosphite/phosphonate ABC transporter substrate-binding protein [Capsulimonadales bacterium]